MSLYLLPVISSYFEALLSAGASELSALGTLSAHVLLLKVMRTKLGQVAKKTLLSLF